MFLSLQGMHFPLRTHHPWSLLMPFSFDKSPLLLPVIKPLWLWRSAQKDSFFPLFHPFQTPVSSPSYSSLFPPINPLQILPIPLVWYNSPFFPLSFPFLTSNCIKMGKKPTFHLIIGPSPFSASPANHSPYARAQDQALKPQALITIATIGRALLCVNSNFLTRLGFGL